MPVSPADFEFYSRMTGQPIPNTPAGRMAIAPQVYNMRRGGGGFGRFLRGAAKGALAAGALAGAGALALATQEEMAKKPSAPQTKAKPDENIDLDSDVPKTVRASALRDEADRLSASVLGTNRGAQMSAPDLTASTSFGGPRVLSGDALDAAEAAVFDDPRVLIGEPAQNRISGQTQVPQADPNITFESRGAQIASTSEPTQPRVEVRQQPSSGVQVTDLSNVAAKDYVAGKVEPGTEMITNYEANQLAQQYELHEASPHGSPFQAEGAMGMLADQTRSVEAQEKEIAREILADFAEEGKGRMAGQALAPRPFTQKEANTRIVGLVKEGIEQLEGGQPSIQFPKGEGSKYESMTLDPSGDINVKFRKGDKTYSYPQTPEGSEAFAQLAGLYNNPGPAKPAEKSPVELGKQMVTDAGKGVVGAVLNLMGSKKMDPREQRIRDSINKGRKDLNPDQREDLIQKMLNQ